MVGLNSVHTENGRPGLSLIMEILSLLGNGILGNQGEQISQGIIVPRER